MAYGDARLRSTSVFVAALALACSSDPDVVAQAAKSDHDGFNVDPAESCRVGVYKGVFTGSVGSLESPIPFNGEISFTLEAVAEKEFPVIKDPVLEATSDDLPVEVIADVNGGADCREGAFAVDFSGTYTIGGNATGYAFAGPITGEYYTEPTSAFMGTWEANDLNNEPLGWGAWIASWTTE